jgi:hypothetical protein
LDAIALLEQVPPNLIVAILTGLIVGHFSTGHAIKQFAAARAFDKLLKWAVFALVAPIRKKLGLDKLDLTTFEKGARDQQMRKRPLASFDTL